MQHGMDDDEVEGTAQYLGREPVGGAVKEADARVSPSSVA